MSPTPLPTPKFSLLQRVFFEVTASAHGQKFSRWTPFYVMKVEALYSGGFRFRYDVVDQLPREYFDPPVRVTSVQEGDLRETPE